MKKRGRYTLLVFLLGLTALFIFSHASFTGNVVQAESNFARLQACVGTGKLVNDCRMQLLGIGAAPASRAVEFKQTITTLWQNRKGPLNTMVNAYFNQHSTLGLYYLEEFTVNLFHYAAKKRDSALLDELLTIYLNQFDQLQMTDTYTYLYLQGRSEVKTTIPITPQKMWVDSDKFESVVSSAQFLSLVTDALNVISTISPNERTEPMKKFAAAAAPIVKEHYLRWIFGEPGIFQVAGGGCKDKTTGVVQMTYNHRDWIKHRFDRAFITRDPVFPRSYCNEVDDNDMRILMGVVSMLAANTHDPILMPIDAADRQRLLTHVVAGIQLVQSRLTPITLTDFNGNSAQGFNFDLGSADDRPQYYWSAYTGDIPPTDATPHQPAKNINMDISHGGRVFRMFATFYDNRAVTGQSFPDDMVMRGLTNQLIYGAFNKDFNRPLFSNFMDGTNGWYVTGEHYHPSDLSASMIRDDYGSFARFNPDMKKVMDAYEKLIVGYQQHQDAALVDFVNQHYSKGSQTVEDIKKPDGSTDTFNKERSLELLMFWPSRALEEEN